jgi:hypothetical protein
VIYRKASGDSAKPAHAFGGLVAVRHMANARTHQRPFIWGSAKSCKLVDGRSTPRKGGLRRPQPLRRYDRPRRRYGEAGERVLSDLDSGLSFRDRNAPARPDRGTAGDASIRSPSAERAPAGNHGALGHPALNLRWRPGQDHPRPTTGTMGTIQLPRW